MEISITLFLSLYISSLPFYFNFLEAIDKSGLLICILCVISPLLLNSLRSYLG